MTPNRSWASPRRRARRRGRSSGRPLAPGSARTWSCSGVRRLRTPPPAPLGGSVPGIDARPPQPLLTGWPLCGALWPPAAFGSQRAPHRGSPRRRLRRHTAISAPPLGGSRAYCRCRGRARPGSAAVPAAGPLSSVPAEAGETPALPGPASSPKTSAVSALGCARAHRPAAAAREQRRVRGTPGVSIERLPPADCGAVASGTVYALGAMMRARRGPTRGAPGWR
jgi:hypothetical protein